MLTVFMRSILLYGSSLLAMRAMGKRQVGQLQPFEMVVVIMIAELAATPMGGVGIPLLYGIIPMAALVVCHGLLTAACMKWQGLRVWLCGEPSVLVRGGVLCEKQLRKAAVDLNDLMEAMRMEGVADPSQVEWAVLEPGGKITVQPKAACRPVTPEDLNLTPVREGLPLPLVMDGVVQQDNLQCGHLTENWLRLEAERAGFPGVQEVLFMCLNTRGELLIQGKGQTETHLRQVMSPEKAVW